MLTAAIQYMCSFPSIDPLVQSLKSRMEELTRQMTDLEAERTHFRAGGDPDDVEPIECARPPLLHPHNMHFAAAHSFRVHILSETNAQHSGLNCPLLIGAFARPPPPPLPLPPLPPPHSHTLPTAHCAIKSTALRLAFYTVPFERLLLSLWAA